VKPLLLATVGRALTSAPLGRREDDVEVRRVPALPVAAALDAERPTVVLLDRALLSSVGSDHSRLVELAEVAAIVGIGDAGESAPPAHFPAELLTSWVAGDASPATMIAQLRGAFRHAASIIVARSARREETIRHHELTELTRVGVALSTVRDLTSLLEMILSQSRRLTGADAGSVYLTVRDPDDDGRPEALRFKLAQNFSLPSIPLQEHTVPFDHTSLAGYAASTGEPLVIADVYLLPDDVEYRQNRSFDEKFGYRTKSMLVIPMKSHRDEIVGVLQLINRKRTPDARLSNAHVVEREVISFDQRAVELVTALASQAAVAIENSLLYEDIERLFEGFVTAAVTAIESRDPTTFGHSGRVATLSVGLAEAVDRAGVGAYRAQRFTREQLRELRYAGLLHDFGKVGVREQVLVKEKKLYPADLELIRHRAGYLLQQADLETERKLREYLVCRGREGYEHVRDELEAAREERKQEIRRFLAVVMSSNEPTILPDGSFDELRRLSGEIWLDPDGVEHPLLSGEELRFLTIRKGNLDEAERREIESHVTHTWRFLQQIPWTRELRNIPEIAYGHHEKLNGRGYPRRVEAPAIPVQTRMMTIADIYDALTATDRPYKRAVSAERALDILGMEAKDGMIDRDLLETFVDARVWQLVRPIESR
jgi:HD-GYP domain-containing protein (c-di-GMP phosphodiesterase class II)